MLNYKKSFKKKLRKRKIRSFDKLIHDQSKDWLIKNFSKGADEYPVNVVMLIRNIVWQMRERVMSGRKPPFKELIRTFWYMYIKPTLDRCNSLSTEWDQYDYLIETIVDMVKLFGLMKYKDIGFRDENKAYRKVGKNANIIIFSEKTSEWDFLSEIANKYGVSIMALGNQPSVLSVEYFVDEIKKAGWDLRTSFYLFSIVDYDTSGWIIKDAFVKDLNFYGIKNIHMTELMTPDMLTPHEIKMSKYRIPVTKGMKYKNKKWLRKIKSMNYRNQKDLADKKSIYGLECQAVSTMRMSKELEKKMVPLLGKKEKFLKIYELKQLIEVLDKLMLHKLKGG